MRQLVLPGARAIALVLAATALMPSLVHAQSEIATATLDPVTVTATRRAERSFDVPAAIDSIDGATIRDGQPAINLSESLARVPGVFAANRNNYAQDLQISSRGFGGRATFGVRGVRLYQDFIPATMPDGQGQTGSFSLLAAERIEVLRGPFSTLYGNASGGVISVFTENPTKRPVLDFTASIGNYKTYIAGMKATGTAGRVGYVVAGSHFDTDGYRAHSAATRDIVNAKMVFDVADKTRVTVIASSQHQPDSQDPLGLTQAQWDANPRGADPATELFNTRKTVNQSQGGVAIEHDFSPSTMMRVTGYGGRRQIGQYLALTGVGPTSSGGVVNLDRDFGGLGARLIWNGSVAGQPLRISVGADTDGMREKRQGFVNDFGSQGALRRDEDDTVASVDAYGQVEWMPLPAIALTFGVRSSRVKYESEDHYIVPPNPDDSGSRTYTNTSPIAGVVWHATDALNVYASYGKGFETPTFAELAYRPGGTGLNLDLDPSTSSSWEVGVKWFPAKRQRVNVALFATDTKQEIVIDAATGGRTTFKNASKTRRRGIEAEWDGHLGAGFTAHVNYSWLRAEFADDFTSGLPPLQVAAGSRLPGVPSQQAFGVIDWTPGGYYGFNAGLEIQHVGRIYVNDRNTAFAPSYTIGNMRVGLSQAIGNVKIAEYIRVNNMTDVNYAGSVIVGDTNGRFFEPAMGRNWFAGISVNAAF